MTETSNSIISFPQERVVRVSVPEEMQVNALINKKRYIDILVQSELIRLTSTLSMYGADLRDEKFSIRLALVIECLRATLYGNQGLDHPLQDAMDELIEIMNEWAAEQ